MWTVGKMPNKLPVATLQPVTGPVCIMGPSDFELWGALKSTQRDANCPASRLQTLEHIYSKLG
jgi:hypothetical protein